MKRVLISLLVLTALSITFAKISVVVSASQLLAGIKHELVPHGALQYEKVTSSMSDGLIRVSAPSFKAFAFKQDFKATELLLDFGSPTDLVLGALFGLAKDYSYLKTISVKGIRTDLPNDEFFERVANQSDSKAEIWLGWLTCDGGSQLDQEFLSRIGIEALSADMHIKRVQQASQEEDVLFNFEVITKNLGSIDLNTKQTKDASGLFSDLSLEGLSYSENGYFKRLALICPKRDIIDESERGDLATDIMSSWVALLRDNNLRVDEGTKAVITSFMRSGGRIELALEQSLEGGADAAKPSYGWQPKDFENTLVLSLNSGDGADVRVEQYVPAPKVVNEPQLQETKALAYTDVSAESLGELIGQQVRVTMLNEKIYEGHLTVVDEHLLTIDPLDAEDSSAGKISYTLQRIELAKLEVWH